MAEEKKPLFKLGQVVMTPGARDALQDAGEEAFTYLFRHAAGDWGTLPAEDEKANADAIQHGDRLLSVYLTSKNSKIWVITEWDRSYTTVLLPEEY